MEISKEFLEKNISELLIEMVSTANFDITHLTKINNESDRQDIIHHMDEIKKFADLIISSAKSIKL